MINLKNMFTSLVLGSDPEAREVQAKVMTPGDEKVKAPSPGVKAVPTYLGRTKGATVPNSLTNTTNLSLSAHARTAASVNEVVQRLARVSPDLSAAIESKIRAALPTSWTCVAYDQVGRIDPAGTELLHMFLMRISLGDYDYTKFTRGTDIRSLFSSLLLDSYRYGGMMLEVVLGKSRIPAYFSPIPYRLIEWADNTPDVYPVYNGKGGKVPLNYPTVFHSSSLQDSEFAYSESPLQSAVQSCVWGADFIDTLRRAANKNLLQRLVVTVDSEKFMASLPQAVQNDPEQVKELQAQIITDLEGKLANLSADDALVIFDNLEADTIADANRSEDRSMDVLQAIINGKISTGAKILPSIIGRGESSSAASTESLLFLKQIASAQLEVDSLISRALTFCLRLFNSRSYASFKMEEVNLRPSLELESFKAIRQSRINNDLSTGKISDIEACILLTGHLPPEGYKELSGTMFSVTSPNTGSGNDYSNTSVDTDSGKTDSTKSQKDGEAEKKGVKSK